MMGQVESRPIQLHYTRSTAPVQRRTAQSPSEAAGSLDGEALEAVAEAQPVRLRQIGEERTTGFFAAPSGDGNLVRLDVFLSSFSSEEQSAEIEVTRAVNGSMETLFFRSIGVAAGGARRVEVGEVGGETLKVTVRLSSPDLVPSAAVTQMFLADGAIVTLVFRSPEDFVRI